MFNVFNPYEWFLKDSSLLIKPISMFFIFDILLNAITERTPFHWRNISFSQNLYTLENLVDFTLIINARTRLFAIISVNIKVFLNRYLYYKYGFTYFLLSLFFLQTYKCSLSSFSNFFEKNTLKKKQTQPTQLKFHNKIGNVSS